MQEDGSDLGFLERAVEMTHEIANAVSLAVLHNHPEILDRLVVTIQPNQVRTLACPHFVQNQHKTLQRRVLVRFLLLMSCINCNLNITIIQ